MVEPAITEKCEMEQQIQAMLEGDSRAFRRVYRALAPKLYRRFLRLLSDASSAEECLHQVFVEIVDHLHTYRGEGRFERRVQQTATHL